ncbi:HAMP domain-containing protein [Sutcliffiella horikoshii]|uniref:histidine kinase n=1 Tax=Sutcliffiella horikoshii TaxID=79883 RepID=A0A5D4SVW0_9BACI|nr:ATP-binding protein [Sutcliffiella horikoshii]TYS67510.1 HAMP domain-containing protein [Sutcliffiella horikoshii]
MKWKNSISKKFLTINGIFFVVLVTGIITLLVYEFSLSEEFKERNGALEDKEKLIQTIDDDINSSFLKYRGYVAFSNQEMLKEAKGFERDIRNNIEGLTEMAETENDKQFVDKVTDFHTFYFSIYLPKVEDLYERGNMNELEDYLFNQGTSDDIFDFMDYMKEYRYEVDREIENNVDLMSDKTQASQLLFSLYFLLVISLLFIITWVLIKQVGRPLRELSEAADNITNGKITVLPSYQNSSDEIGVLTNALHTMVNTLQYKEEELIAQNEELLAQQDELHAQQDELQAQQVQLEDNISIIEESNEQLEVRNKFIHDMAETLSRERLLENVVRNMGKVLGANVGIMMMLNDKKTAASIGLPKRAVEQLKSEENNVFLQQLLDVQKAFKVDRKCSRMEATYHSEDMAAFDLFIPVLTSNDIIAAYMQFTRYDAPFTEREIETGEALAMQVSMALEKVDLYEDSEENRLFYQDILNTIQEGVLLVDERGSVLQANTKMSSLMNFPTPNRLLQLSFEEWTTVLVEMAVDKEKLRTDLLSTFSEKEFADDALIFELYQRHDRCVFKMYKEKVSRQDLSYGYILVFRDMTKEYEVDRMKSEFVSTVSHELRTPLASVLGFTERMIYKELTEERKKTYLKTIYQEAKRLTALINDFLDVQKMEAGKQVYRKKPENIVEIIQEASDIFQHNANTHPILLEVMTEQTKVEADREKLSQVMANLLSNAIKYSPDGGKIHIAVISKAEMLQVTIRDHGIGIPKEAIPHLFTKFYRVDNSDLRKIGGTGLGLSIVKEIIHAHDGDIRITSQMEEGTVVTIEIPLAK